MAILHFLSTMNQVINENEVLEKLSLNLIFM